VRIADDGEVVYVFEPDAVALPALVPYAEDLWRRRHFIAALARTELKASRFNTVAGQVWDVLDPLLQAAVYFVLIVIVRGGGTRATSTRLTLLIGSIFLFNYTRNSLIAGAKSVVSEKGLVLNSSFPVSLLPLTSVVKAFLELLRRCRGAASSRTSSARAPTS
jgi:ABC-type polysaccharide/polyol phosphate export permease